MTTLLVLLIVFVATIIRSTFGFGESLVAVPLLILFLPVEIAVPLSVLISIFIAFVVILQDHSEIHFRSAIWLILFAILGIPVGLWLLVHGDEIVVKPALGLLIVLYSIYSLAVKSRASLVDDHMPWMFLCGFLSGVFGGAYGINGPPLVVYGNMRGWSARQFRATLQAYFLPASLIGMSGYWYNGLWNSTVTRYFLMSIPVLIPAIVIGRILNHKITTGAFFRYVYIGLIAVGLLLIIQSFFFT